MRDTFTILDGERQPVAFAFVASTGKPYQPAVLTGIYVLHGYENRGLEQTALTVVMSHARRECLTLIAPADDMPQDLWDLLSDNGWLYKSTLKALVKDWQ